MVHSVIVYPDMVGEWYFAEIDGNTVYRFEPFESYKLVKELVVLFPETPVLELVEASALMDNSVLMILGNAERVTKVAEEQEIAWQ